MLPVAIIALCLAAPVPSLKRQFGDNGFVTRAELEALSYAKPTPLGKDVPAHVAGLGIALHLPRTRFVEGAPIPAYFIIRGSTLQSTGLDMRLDLFRSPTTVNSCAIHLVPKSKEKAVMMLRSHLWSCGRSSLVTVPMNGYYCVRGQLEQFGGGTLPAGEYECWWSHSTLRSRTVTFTVLPGAIKSRPVAPRRLLRFFEVIAPSDDGDEPKGMRFVPLHTSGVAATLAVGLNERYYPDVNELPDRDERVIAEAKWVADRDGGRIRVTLRPRDESKPVTIADDLHLYVQVEQTRDDREDLRVREGDRKMRMLEAVTLPLTREVRLPKEWGKARIAVMVTTTRLELPSDRALTKEVKRLVRSTPPWSGLLRTPYVEVGRER